MNSNQAIAEAHFKQMQQLLENARNEAAFSSIEDMIHQVLHGVLSGRFLYFCLMQLPVLDEVDLIMIWTSTVSKRLERYIKTQIKIILDHD